MTVTLCWTGQDLPSSLEHYDYIRFQSNGSYFLLLRPIYYELLATASP